MIVFKRHPRRFYSAVRFYRNQARPLLQDHPHRKACFLSTISKGSGIWVDTKPKVLGFLTRCPSCLNKPCTGSLNFHFKAGYTNCKAARVSSIIQLCRRRVSVFTLLQKVKNRQKGDFCPLGTGFLRTYEHTQKLV